MEENKRYIIDLSQAQSPADILFELSSLIEKNEATNKRIWLKIADISLNQSQLMSINSLINSLNSNLEIIETLSDVTKESANILGISVNNIETALEEEIKELDEKLNVVDDKPSEQYIPMVDHIDEECNEAESIEEVLGEAIDSEVVDVNELKNDEPDSDINAGESSQAVVQSEVGIEKDQDIEYEVDVETSLQNEEIQNQLDKIFDSEVKLENMFSEEKSIEESKNWPLAVEYQEIEIPEDELTDEDYEILKMDTLYHKHTVRSGQVIKSNGNIVIVGDCHPGCEIQAGGDITVWGILSGVAHAGCNGNSKARIRALNLNAIQLRIADSYARRPDHIKNVYVEKSNMFTPEEARNINGSIVILKVNDK